MRRALIKIYVLIYLVMYHFSSISLRLYFTFFVLISFTVNGQLIEKVKLELSNVHTIEQANKYLANQSSITGQLFELNALADSTDFDKELLTSDVGNIIDFESEDKKKHLFFKTLESFQIKSFRVQYIFLDNSKLDINQIDSLRNMILKKVDRGESFAELAKEYSMDNNSQKGGDLGWFEEGMMRKEFEGTIKSKKYGDVFKVDIPSEKWYYVVRNSHEPRMDKKVIILYIEISGL